MHQIHWKMDTLQQAISARTTYAGGGATSTPYSPGFLLPCPPPLYIHNIWEGRKLFQPCRHIYIYIYIYIYI